jgi:hypothetical protein
MCSGVFLTFSFPNHLAAAICEAVLGKTGAPSSTVSYGSSVPALLGRTCLNDIPPTRPAIADFSNGCDQGSCEVSWKHSLKICGSRVGSTSVKPSSMAALPPQKGGFENRQNQTWQGN